MFLKEGKVFTEFRLLLPIICCIEYGGQIPSLLHLSYLELPELFLCEAQCFALEEKFLWWQWYQVLDNMVLKLANISKE